MPLLPQGLTNVILYCMVSLVAFYIKLQLVQKCRAGLILGGCKYDHITPLLRELHWLPIEHCIALKLHFPYNPRAFQLYGNHAVRYQFWRRRVISTDGNDA